MHHGINHPHLHSLLAHCRNPYMTGESWNLKLWIWNWIECLNRRWAAGLSPTTRYASEWCCATCKHINYSNLMVVGQGFPWAHSTRGKPRRGMMRRAVFSGNSKHEMTTIEITNCHCQIHNGRAWKSDFRFKSTSANLTERS
jgi:hypothetical protein